MNKIIYLIFYSLDALRLQTPTYKPYIITNIHQVAWFHPPKAGTSFGATVLHYANSSLPATEGARRLWVPFWRKYPRDVWFKNPMLYTPCDHAKVTEDDFRRFEGHFVGIFRNPSARISSAYVTKGHLTGDFLKYAARAEGTVTMQLAGQADGEKWLYWPGDKYCGGRGANKRVRKPKPQIKIALDRLHKGFKFVGLTEEYDLSVCLFHAMFGGECLQIEFDNMRATKYPTNRTEQNIDLRNHSDVIDGELYQAAYRHFWKDVKKYNVTRSVCLKLCPQAGKIFGSDLEIFHAHESDYDYNWPGRYYLDEDDMYLDT